jgi:hypothetical protein
VTVLEDNTAILDGPSASVECLAQQGVERVVEVTPASGVASNGSSNPSFRLLLGLKVSAEARAAVATFVVGVSSDIYSSGWALSGGAGGAYSESTGEQLLIDSTPC